MVKLLRKGLNIMLRAFVTSISLLTINTGFAKSGDFDLHLGFSPLETIDATIARGETLVIKGANSSKYDPESLSVDMTLIKTKNESASRFHVVEINYDNNSNNSHLVDRIVAKRLYKKGDIASLWAAFFRVADTLRQSTKQPLKITKSRRKPPKKALSDLRKLNAGILTLTQDIKVYQRELNSVKRTGKLTHTSEAPPYKVLVSYPLFINNLNNEREKLINNKKIIESEVSDCLYKTASFSDDSTDYRVEIYASNNLNKCIFYYEIDFKKRPK
jgi:hypothetical protein